MGSRSSIGPMAKGPVKVLMIIGLAGTHDSWLPQIKELAGTVTPNDSESPSGDGGGNGNVEVCAFDNRGMGLSSVPIKKHQYTTRIMAKDAIALMDHLGWEKAHVFGHSMGAMIACKLAAMVPNRILSLALLNVTGGGFQCIPKFDRRTLSIAVRFLKAKTPEQRAAVDLDTHYSKEFLEEYVGTITRRAILYQEYVKPISATGMQSKYDWTVRSMLAGPTSYPRRSWNPFAPPSFLFPSSMGGMMLLPNLPIIPCASTCSEAIPFC
ncbi:unnamed protein product [Cuscuta campestris]|uniref:AB hydrolase-1 domain-containing protein n=1 Tax=Cuscuta campestris TaxID=132261 RepID=A0A484L8L1_9ASTE|nr:unnamed protein product [Cuscuta campestris]